MLVGVADGLGQRRRVDLGLGIIGRPEVLFLDEPTTGLDPEARRALWAVNESLVAAGTTVLLAHHVDPSRGELSLPSADLTADLDALVGWARRNRADLTGLEVTPPGLEDAHIALTTGLPPAGEPADPLGPGPAPALPPAAVTGPAAAPCIGCDP